MIPFIRSLTELMAITESSERLNKSIEENEPNDLSEEQRKLKSFTNPKKTKVVELPDLTKKKRRKWIKSKAAISRFLHELDYNNQIQSSYDLTLIQRQNNYDQHDAA